MSAVLEPATLGSKEEKRELLERLLRERAARQERWPLSFAQHRLWFLDQLTPGDAAYNIAAALVLHGYLEPPLLAASLREIVRRHKALRATFKTEESRPVQVVSPETAVPLPVLDVSGLPPQARREETRRLAAWSGGLPFDLERGPLLRAGLVRVREEESVLLLALHHIAADGWSLGLLFRELAALYTAFAEGRPSPLPELPIQYGDYVRWQRRALAGAALDAQLAYWREQLAGAPAALELPTDRPRPPLQSSRGAALSFALPRALGDRLAAFAHGGSATLFMVLSAGFQALLARYTGQETIPLGSPIAGRNRRDLEKLIGLFVNTIVLATDLSGRPTFRELLQRVRQVALGAYGHQDLPFEKLVGELQPERDLSRTPLFQAMLVLQNTPAGPLALPGLTLAPLAVESGTAKFDLTLTLEESGDGLAGVAEYARDLFDRTSIQRLLAHLEALLAAATARPDAPLAELPLTSAAERQQLLREWNDSAERYRGPATLLGWIAGQVRRSPERVAVVGEGEELRYRELGERSDRLARRLRRLGVAAEVPVALCAERSPELIVGLLAILKAGGAYVPLDPSYPHGRLAGMLDDALGGASPALLLTHRGLWEAGAGPAGLERVFLDSHEEEDGETGWAEPLPENLAYVIYTSGSTGRPKGAMNQHGAVLNRLLWMQSLLDLAPGEGVLQKTPVSFDVSVWELFLPLMVGARLVLARPEGHKDPAYLIERIEQAAVTTAHFVPSMLAAFLDEPEVARCRSLKRVVASGEALSGELARRFAARLPWAALVNLYGPTEAAVDVTCHVCRAEAGAAVPLGRPIANVFIHLLDREGEPVPPGVAGEISIGGMAVGRGYLGRPDLTAERFVPHPAGAGERRYRTGDLGRRGSSGELEYLGRLDHQVKVRGVRIELGEIEAVLARHPGVREAVVLAREASGEVRLAAYVVPGAEAPELDELRAHLRAHLPEAMVPPHLLVLDRLPLLPNGKLDRRALPAPASPPSAGGGAPPRTPLERQLAGIWRDVLGVPEIAPETNFFDAGGHSLRLVEVQGRLRRDLGLAVSIVELFQHPTIAALAEHLENHERAPRPAIPPPIVREVREGDLAIVGMAGRFPGARSPEELWQNLRDGVESIRRLGREELLAAGRDPDQPGLVPAEATLEGIELFDADFFGFAPREAEVLDPQQRIFLECAWECLERAGYDAARYRGRIGVYAGAGWTAYALNVLTNPGLLGALDGLSVQTALDKDFLATRVSYLLGLRGPSVAVQTACSTSLVALHLARQALLAGDCEMALVGGVSIRVPQGQGYLYQEGGIRSPDGHCRAFDAEARGTVFGSGAGVVLLKPLADALRDGDAVHAVVKGSAINNDGARKVGFTAPGVDGQAEVIAAALRASGVPVDSLGYVEAHGTATPLGDPVEVAALTQAFAGAAERPGFCALGSVKTNFGHLDAAAGVAGLLKTVLALGHRQIPPTLHFTRPNPRLDLAASPFYVNDRLLDWLPQPGHPRRAGVSSFGVGGTNAHLILEEAPALEPASPARPCHLLLLSARTPAALDAATQNLAAFFARHPGAIPADVAYTLQVGRRAFAHRRVRLVEAGESPAALAQPAPERWLAGRTPKSRPALVFLFPGQGAQHADMGRGLYETELAFRAEIDACAEALKPRLGRDLRDLLYPPPAGREAAERELRETAFAQPALFATEYALARLWLSWGVTPRAMAGHSLGEYVAACLAGVFPLDAALALVAARGALVQSLPRGAMLAVKLAPEELAPRLGPELALAAVNGPAATVASGPEPAVASLARELAEAGVEHRALATSHAFHSPVMEPILGRFRELVAGVERRPPTLPFLSNLTGTWITAGEATDPDYWVRHLRNTVRFGPSLDVLGTSLGGALFLEVGPGRALASLARQSTAAGTAVSSMRRRNDPRSDLGALLEAAGRLWLSGAEIDWEGFQGGARRRRVVLPTYPFQRRRFWLEPGAPASAASAASAVSPAPAALPAEPAQPAHAPAAEDRPAAPGRHERPELATPYRAPGSAAERRLAEIWQDLLGIDRVGIDDDFFDLGGHSLLATRVLSRAREALAAELDLDDLFAATTVATLAARIAARQEAAHPAQSLPPLVPEPRGGFLPLSFAQQRLWFLDQLDPESAAYLIPAAVRLTGALAPAALAAALGEIVRRHESLRTAFHPRPEQSGEPGQAIAPAGPFLLPRIDLSALPEPARREEGERIARNEAARPFDLRSTPMLRATLLAVDACEHTVLLTLHHIASDGWSIGILVRELGALYGAGLAGLPSPLPELPVQYADFALWQRRRLAGPALEAELAHWRERLADLPPALELPADRPRPALQALRGASRPFAVPAGLRRSLEALGRSRRATLFMTLLAAFQALLARYTGEERIAIGSPVAGRSRVELEDLIGFFVNTLVLATDVSSDPSFAALLDRVREVALAAFAHQDLPFEKLVEALQPERDLSRAPLFQVLFVLQNAPASTLSLPGLAIEPIAAESSSTRFDLTLALEENGAGLSGRVEYDRDLFDGATIARLLGHLETLLSGAAAAPETPLSRLPLLSPAEEHQLLAAWSDTAAPSRGGCLHSAFEAWAAAAPDRVALACGAGQWTYAGLDAAAGRLARRLRAHGVGPEVRVGVLLERTAALVVSLLAVLKAGGAYVPLNPTYPAERLALLLADSGAPVVLTERRLAGVLPAEPAAARLLCLEALDGPGETAPSGSPSAPSPQNLAYLIYTSGSTGRPKAVAVEHRSPVELVRWSEQVFSAADLAAVLAATSIGFDLSVFELFVPLSRGGRVVLVDNALALPALPGRDGITLVNTVPSAMAILAEGDLPAGLRVVNLAGEPLREALAARCHRPGLRLFNLYGPSEDTTYSTGAEIAAGDPVTLGRPLANTRALVLDASGAPVPAGVPGELHLAGAGLARGYLGRPELTAERFLPDPFGGRPGGRLYRTGDRVRWTPGGTLQYLGRLDHQVKLRGFRIELGEIEAALLRHPAIAEAVVAHDREGARLLAYLAFRAATGEREELRGFLRRHLPEHMVPAHFVVLPALPRLANGKVDRRALPQLFEQAEWAERAAAEPPLVPRTPLELALVRLWEELLAVRPVGVRDSFFALGGHSLLAVRLMAAIRERLGRDLPVAALFAAPTVEQLARRLAPSEDGGDPAWSPLVALNPRGERRPLFFVHPIGGQVLCYLPLAQELGPERPFHGLQAPGLDRPDDSPGSSIEELAARYVQEVLRAEPEGPYLLGGWSFGGVVAFEMAQQLRRRGREVELLALLDTPLPTGGDPEAEVVSGALVASLAREQARQAGRELSLAAADLAGLPLDGQLARALDALRALAVLGPEVDAALLHRYFGGYLARRRMLARYEARPYAGRIDLFRARERDPETAAAAPGSPGADPALGWGGRAASVQVQFVPGYHETMIAFPHVRELARLLAASLDRVDPAAAAAREPELCAGAQPSR